MSEYCPRKKKLSIGLSVYALINMIKIPLFKKETKKMTRFIRFISSVNVTGLSKYANSIIIVLKMKFTIAIKSPTAVDEYLSLLYN